jgi:hypothetical protein
MNRLLLETAFPSIGQPEGPGGRRRFAKELTEKEKLELAAAHHFIGMYNASHKRPITFVSQARPPRADVCCRRSGKKFGMEIAHIYGSETDAKRLFQHNLRNPISQRELLEDSLIPRNEKIINELNRILHKKSRNGRYADSRVWLVIRNAYPLWQKDDFLRHRKNIDLPDRHPFERIWLVCDASGESGLLKLY